MFDTRTEIETAVREKESDMTRLRLRMDEDFDLLTLQDYSPKGPSGKARKGYEAYTSSAPRNHYGKVSDGLNRSALTIQVKLAEGANEKQRKAASVGELYLFGALNANDRRLFKLGQPPLREDVGFFMNVRGWYAVRTLVFQPAKRSKDEVSFDITAWDPMHATWETGGPNGLIWYCQKRWDTRAQIFAQYGIKINGKGGEIWDWWDEEKNTVIIMGHGGFAKEPKAHNIGHVPVLIGPVGSMPTVQGTGFVNTLEFQGDSVWSSSRNLYEPSNKFTSWVMDIAKKAVAGSLTHETESGLSDITGDPYGTFRIIPLKKGEPLKPLELPKAPAEMVAAIQTIQNDIEQSTLPSPYAYGGTREAISGRALSILADATRSVFNPYTGAMARVYTWVCEELLRQYSQKGTKPVELTGFKPGKGAKDDFFEVKVKPKDINPSWFVDVQVEPRMPRDESEEIQQALAVTSKRNPEDEPLMSKGTARETYLHIRDPDAEKEKVLIEEGTNMLPIKTARMAAAMEEAGDSQGADIMLAWMQSQGIGAPPAPPGAGPGTNGAAPQPAQEEPIQVQVIKAVLQVLEQAGAQDLAQALVQSLDDPQGPPPQLIEAIVQVLVQAGEQALAEAFLAALQAGAPPEAGGAPAGAQGPAAPTQDQRLANVGLAGPRG